MLLIGATLPLTIRAQNISIGGNKIVCPEAIEGYYFSGAIDCYVVSWYASGGKVVGSSGFSAAVEWDSTTGPASLKASYFCSYSNTYSSVIIPITIRNLKTGPISGPSSFCAGSGSKYYSVGAVSGATSYTWDVIPKNNSFMFIDPSDGQQKYTLTTSNPNIYAVGNSGVSGATLSVRPNGGCPSNDTTFKSVTVEQGATHSDKIRIYKQLHPILETTMCGNRTYTIRATDQDPNTNEQVVSWSANGQFTNVYYGSNFVDVTTLSDFYYGNVCVTLRNSCGLTTTTCQSFSRDYSCNPALMIQENEQPEVDVFPNPVANVANIHWPDTVRAVAGTIVNSLGRTAQSFRPSGSGAHLDVSTLPAGVYQIIIQTDQGILRRRFVKK